MNQTSTFGLGQLWRYTREDGTAVTRLISGLSPKLVFYHEATRLEGDLPRGSLHDNATYHNTMWDWVRQNKAQLL